MKNRRLPHLERAQIDERKISDYLLAAAHPAGRAKAAFFERCGFRLSEPQRLRDALLRHAAAASVSSISDTEFGIKYVLSGTLDAPNGRKRMVRAIWFIAAGDTVPKLVTAYPKPRIGR